MSQLKILHVEDDPDDAFFLSRAIKKTMPGCQFHREDNGERAIRYLSQTQEGKVAGSIPDLIILDLKLPGLSGFEVLAWTRSQPAFQAVPIIILSGSPLEDDHNKAADLGASEFLVKHSEFDQIALQIAEFNQKNALVAATTGNGVRLSPIVKQQ